MYFLPTLFPYTLYTHTTPHHRPVLPSHLSPHNLYTHIKDDLTGKWARLSLNTQESQTIPLAPTTEDNTRVLIAKLFTKRRVNIEVLSRTLRSMWHSIQEFEIRDLGSNKVLLLFTDEADTLKILAQQPWSFDKYLTGLYKPMEHESMEAATFDYATFWI